MRKLARNFLLLFSVFFTFVACSKSQEDVSDSTLPPKEEEEKVDSFYEREKKRSKLLENNDMVLLYSGGAHREYQWNEELVKPYVTYVDTLGKEHWLFDSFLFLEIHDGRKGFASGYRDTPTNQYDWKKLVDHFFQSKYCLGALNKSIASAKKRLGEPPEKRKVVIGIPEPIKTQKSWGTLSNKVVMLDFSNSSDRIDAVKWYIDYTRQKFSERDYENLELAGFYWIPENATNSRDILAEISSYLNSFKYSFTWIPYHYADGAFEWKELDFNYAFFQPNYFFNETRPISLLNRACEKAIEHNMDMEIEFDERALVSRNNWGYRLKNYMKAFKDYGIWENKRIAYYQGGTALYNLSKSTNNKDNELYHKFCEFVIERSK